MHLLHRVTRCRVFQHRNLVPELGSKAYRGLHARVRYKAYNNELMNTMRLELEIQIGIGKTAGAPMLERHDVAGLDRKLFVQLTRGCSRALHRHNCFRKGSLLFIGSCDWAPSATTVRP